MKENPTPTPPDDADPLLAALQQRLGDYGAPPPPGAWAGIRQRLPAPRPWWRRPRRLLPVLALLLGLVATTAIVHLRYGWGNLSPSVGRAKKEATRPGYAPPHTQAATSPAEKSTLPLSLPSHSTLSQPERSQPADVANRLAESAETSRRAASSKSTKPAAEKKLAATSLAPSHTRSAPVVASPAQLAANARPPASTGSAASLVRLAAEKRPQIQAINTLIANAKPSVASATPGPRMAGRLVATLTAQPAQKRLAWPKKSQAYQRANGLRRYRQLLARPRTEVVFTPNAVASRAPATASPLGLASHRRYAYARPSHVARTPWLLAGDSTQLAQPIEAFGLHAVELALPLGPPLPAPLAALPDSLPPAAPVRRWALLAVAGPTLSYRTLGATTPANTTTSRPDFARLERPALGFGAQVQVRRVLSGRWALAVGLGYQEYATRLALQVITDTTAKSVHQRDTYRLLTLPVQLGYALGTPRGQLAKALLAGAEMGWYQGGRSTEGNDCGCQQTPYTTTANPYRSWTLALSLGLDLRYRVGGPAGRWQWVVQPTGRYILTPFTSAATAGFTARRPFSLGLLTGFSWDIR